MQRVGVRDFRNSLSRYLERVRRGETLTVTDRGVPVAHVVPAHAPPRLRQLLAERRATWSGQRPQIPANLTQPSAGPPISEYVAEDRR